MIVSQPEHPNGYEGLALTYEKIGNKEEAIFFIKEAYKRGSDLLGEEHSNETYGSTMNRIMNM